jgi:hypothetical protein
MPSNRLRFLLAALAVAVSPILAAAQAVLTTVAAGQAPWAVAVNSTTNKIYVANKCTDWQHCTVGSITVIDGSSGNTSTILHTPIYQLSDCIPGDTFGCPAVVVDTQRNKVYIAGENQNVVTAIDGATNTAIMAGVGDGPFGLGFNPSTNRIYVPTSDNTVNVLDAGAKLQFVPLTPCRVVDTRNTNGIFGGPAIQGGADPRAFPLPQGSCHIPSNAIAYSLNATVVPHGALGYLTILPSSQFVPPTSTLNSSDGRVKANALIVQAGLNAGVSAYASDNTNLIIDINGYFAAPNSGSNPLSLYTLWSCRALDTRSGRGGEFSGELVIDVLENENSCPMSPQAQAFQFNATAVPIDPLQYLTLWPDGQQQPVVSTLNAPDGAVTSNMAIVPTSNGLIDAYSTNLTHLLLDVSGYFAP